MGSTINNPAPSPPPPLRLNCSKSSTSTTHIIAFPFPAKGHINPMLHLCNLLVSKGLRVTMIYTASTMKSAKSTTKSNNNNNNNNGGGGGGLMSWNSIQTETISDGINTEEEEEEEADKVIGGGDVEAYFKQFRDVATQGLTDVVKKHQRSNHPPRLVLYDSVMPWVLDVAQGLGLLGASFFTQSASVCSIYYHMRLQGLLLEQQQQHNEDPSTTPAVHVETTAPATTTTTTTTTTTLLPLMPPLERKDLPGFDYFLDIKVIVEKLLLDQFSNIEKVDYILFNTYQKLEDEVINWMANQWPVKTIGPTAPPVPLQAGGDKKFMKINGKLQQEDCRYLFETNTEACLKWLDGKEADSVVYISFGSVASLSEEQMGEVAKGINNCDCNFLWVVRDEEDWKLPKSFKSETSEKGKGLVINWCPQLDVLAHNAVACFMTHCGWNSTLEGLSSGVPMIAVPQWVDQTTNAKFIADVWEAGVRVNVKLGMVTSTEIERCIRQVTESERGLELKRNAVKWKKYAKEAVEQGGSSDRNVQDFVSSLLHLIPM